MSVEESKKDPIRNGKDNKGRFLPGHKLSPGRPAGGRNKVTIALQEMVDAASTGLMDKVLQTAMKGDVTAMRLCLERVFPPHKERSLLLDLPDMNTPQDAVQVMSDITRKVSDGEVTPSEAMSVAGVVEVWRKTLETSIIDQRMNELEAKLTKAGI